MATKRVLVQSIAGGTASATITVPVAGTIKSVVFSAIPAAAGSWELSRSSTSQIATTSPDAGVLARARFAAPLSSVGAVPTTTQAIPMNVPVKVLDTLYVHCTGTGNVGEAMIFIE